MGHPKAYSTSGNKCGMTRTVWWDTRIADVGIADRMFLECVSDELVRSSTSGNFDRRTVSELPTECPATCHRAIESRFRELPASVLGLSGVEAAAGPTCSINEPEPSLFYLTRGVMLRALMRRFFLSTCVSADVGSLDDSAPGLLRDACDLSKDETLAFHLESLAAQLSS